ncbi:hypothetical protein [Leadbetterella byssophila]|uniref:Lipoprotein n=1 Tax=Leadbetterella byssophila (strain DSM 17132 / JCM 16389 / KACC 11308 / NBRC 106382 / 4M15) TaxID=649349 RepID=E4RXF8_LEAB4|nr:hypothetical protein [Leadbetterella byssophila]ADQ16303.1 hypothetical protein Lbys_0532 [Leadbetterella byssophila DSM 17132]
MKLLFYLSLLAILSLSSCKEQSFNQEIPYTSLADLSKEAEFRFSIKSSSLGNYPILDDGEVRTSDYLVVINDENAYLNEVVTKYEHPFINFSTHTLLVLGIEYRGTVTLKPRKEGNKTILTVIKKIPELGPQGTVFNTFSAIVPKVDSTNVIKELIEVNVK